MKNILLESTIKSLKEKMSKEFYLIKKNEMQLEILKTSNTISMNEISSQIEQGKKILIAFKNENDQLEQCKNELKSDISNIQKQQISFENYKNFIEISEKDEKTLQLISLETALEDFVNCIRLSFSNQKISFEDSVKLIRKISNQIFKINFIKEKLNNFK
jgi:hypothetical protein